MPSLHTPVAGPTKLRRRRPVLGCRRRVQSVRLVNVFEREERGLDVSLRCLVILHRQSALESSACTLRNLWPIGELVDLQWMVKRTALCCKLEKHVDMFEGSLALLRRLFLGQSEEPRNVAILHHEGVTSIAFPQGPR